MWHNATSFTYFICFSSDRRMAFFFPSKPFKIRILSRGEKIPCKWIIGHPYTSTSCQAPSETHSDWTRFTEWKIRAVWRWSETELLYYIIRHVIRALSTGVERKQNNNIFSKECLPTRHENIYTSYTLNNILIFVTFFFFFFCISPRTICTYELRLPLSNENPGPGAALGHFE